MKNNISIKLMLLGIGFMTFFIYANAINNNLQNTSPGIYESVISVLGAFLPPIGLVLCIIGFFIKEK